MSKLNSKILNKLFNGKNVIIETDENGNLFFEIESTSMAIGYVTKSNGKEYLHKTRMNKTLKNAEITPFVRGVQKFMALNQLNIFLIQSKTKKAMEFQKWVTDEVLPMIEKTGGYVEDNREEEFVGNYLSGLSDDVKVLVIKDLRENNEKLKAENEELKKFLSTEGLYHTNTIAKELKIGRNTLLSYLRGKGILFYQDNSNVPYQRFMNQGLFSVVETPCADGKYRPVTYVTKKGLEYIRKLLRKDGYYDAITE